MAKFNFVSINCPFKRVNGYLMKWTFSLPYLVWNSCMVAAPVSSLISDRHTCQQIESMNRCLSPPWYQTGTPANKQKAWIDACLLPDIRQAHLPTNKKHEQVPVSSLISDRHTCQQTESMNRCLSPPWYQTWDDIVVVTGGRKGKDDSCPPPPTPANIPTYHIIPIKVNAICNYKLLYILEKNKFTLAPWSSSPAAKALPSPWPEPVMMATFP